MTDDAELLRCYAQENSDEAFAELVRRHVDFVYATALRRLGGDTHHAADVAQVVFVKLARQAGRLSNRAVLAGWLHAASRNAAVDVVRSENRRRVREREAMEIKPESTAVEWERVRPALDAALDDLNEADREAVLLRFFSGRRFGDIGTLLGLSEDNARRRVERALEKLRDQLARRGITSTSAALALALANQPIVAAPAALAGAVTGVAIAEAVGAAWLPLAVMSKLKTSMVGLILVVGVATGIVEARANRALKMELAGLQAVQERQVQLYKEGDRLNDALTAAGDRNPAAAELAHLRRRAALLKARPPWVSDGAWKEVARAADAGWASPEAALETIVWARATGDRKVLENNFALTRAAKEAADRRFGELGEKSREIYGSADRLLASAGFMGNEPQDDPVVAYQAGIDPEAKFLRPDTSLRIWGWARLASGRERQWITDLAFLGDRWALSGRGPTDQEWNELVRRLDPVTGKVSPAAAGPKNP